MQVMGIFLTRVGHMKPFEANKISAKVDAKYKMKPWWIQNYNRVIIDLNVLVKIFIWTKGIPQHALSN